LAGQLRNDGNTTKLIFNDTLRGVGRVRQSDSQYEGGLMDGESALGVGFLWQIIRESNAMA